MILNTRIWQDTVNVAKAAAITSPAWLRAIERADLEIRRSRYWAFDGETLVIQSTTSKKFYSVNERHTCDACANGHKACKHRAARRLMIRYTERLKTAPVHLTKTADERADLIAGIKATWPWRHPHTPLADALMTRFGKTKLEMLSVDFLRRVQVALAQ